MNRSKNLQNLKTKKLGIEFGMTNYDQMNFQACFDHIDDILKVLADELNQQLKDKHMAYVIEWGEDLFGMDDLTDDRKRLELLKNMIGEALHVSSAQAIMPVELIGQYKDPWSRIKGFMALRQTAEEVASPISAEEYEEIKEIAIEAERAKPVNLESVYVNMHRPEWTEEQQIKLNKRKG